MKTSKRRALVLTALPVEYQAVREYFVELHEEEDEVGTVYEVGTLGDSDPCWTVCLCEVGAGNVDAATSVERAVNFFHPNVAFFVGVAGGIKDVVIGDVVAATKIYGYESGKEGNESFLPRPNVGISAYRLIQRARAEARKDRWQKTLSDLGGNSVPKVFVAPIAAGEKVVASAQSRTARFLKTHYGDALAVEMEGAGFLRALHAHVDIAAMVVRGISDLLSGKTEADSAGSQQYASKNAAGFAMAILAGLDTIPRADEEPTGDSLKKPERIPKEILVQLNQAIDLMNRQDFQRAIPLFRKVMEMADAGGHRRAAAHARVSLGNAISHTTGGSEEMTLLREALQLASADDHPLRHHILLSMGESLTQKNKLVEAEAAMESAMQEAQHLPPENLAATESALGNLCLRANKSDAALEHYRNAERRLVMAEMSSSTDTGQYSQQLGIARIGLGDVLFRQKRNLEAISSYESAASTFRSSDLANRAIVHHQLGKVFAEQHCDTEAVKHLSESASNYLTLQMYSPLLEVLDKLAGMHMRCQDWESAHDVCQQLLKISPKAPTIKRIEIIRLVSRVLGAMYQDIRPDSNGLLQQAFNGLSKARELAEQQGLLDEIAACAIQAFHLAQTTLSDDVIKKLKASAIAALRNAIDAQRQPYVAAGMCLTLSELFEDNRDRHAVLEDAKRFIATDPNRDAEQSFLIDARIAGITKDRTKQASAYRSLLNLPDSNGANRAEAYTVLIYAAIRRKAFEEAEHHIECLEKLAGERHNAHRVVHDCRVALKHAKLARRGSSFSLKELLHDLDQLLQVNEKLPRTVLGFWYFLWVHELTNLLRSGPKLTIMTVGPNAADFLAFVQRYDDLSDYFLMANFSQPSLRPEDRILSLPENWQFPDSFEYVAFTGDGRFWRTQKEKPLLYPETTEPKPISGSMLPFIPAFLDSMPDYTLINDEGKEGIYACKPFTLQVEGATLMLETPIAELIQRRALWAPIDAYRREDKLLSVLGLSRDRGYVPVFFERWPLSDQVEKKASLSIVVPKKNNQQIVRRLRAILLRILQAPTNAIPSLHELSSLVDGSHQPGELTQLEIALFEFGGQGPALHPAILVAGE